MVIKGIKRFFFGGPKEEIAQYRTPQQMKDLERLVKQQNAEYKALLLKIKAQKEEERRKKEDRKEEEKEKEYILQQKKRLEAIKKGRSLILPCFGLKEFPTFFLKSNVAYKKFAGFYLRQTDEGLVQWAPLLTDGKEKTIPSGNDVWTENPLNIFRARMGFVTQLKGGKVDSNYDLFVDENTGQERLVLCVPKYVHKGEEVKIINLSESERLELERETRRALQHNKEAYNRIAELESMQIDIECDRNKFESDSLKFKKEAEIYKTHAESINQSHENLIKTSSAVLTSMTETKAQAVQAEKLAWALKGALDRYRDILERDLGKTTLDVITSQVEKYFMAVKELSEKQEKPRTEQSPQPRPGVK